MSGIIFDLDNCLAAGDAMGAGFFRPAFEAIRAANQGVLSEAALSHAFADIWRDPYDAVCARHGFSSKMKEAGWAVFTQLELSGPMTGYSDLLLLAGMPRPRFLVTSGFERLQASKARALGIASMFDGIHIDSIDAPVRKGKAGIFAEIASTQGLRPRDIWVVGDNPHSEIEAGNSLDMRTVQLLRPGVQKGDNARYYVNNLSELLELLDSAG